jgi:uncharacterized protein (TIGR03437 family)
MSRRIAVMLSFVAAPFLAHAQLTPVTCSATSVAGTYSLVLNGRDVTTGSALFTKVYNAVGTITFDGVGLVTATLTSNTNSSANTAQKLSGTYAIPSNCVGTITFTSGDNATMTIVPFNNGSNFVLAGQDGTYIFTGSGNPQPVACSNSNLSGGYAFSGNGYALASGQITLLNNISGELMFDGAGNVTGSWAIATQTNSTPDTVTGQYTVTSACVGTATVTDPGGTAYSLAYTITSADGSNLSILGTTPTNQFTVTSHSTFTNPGLAVANAAGVSGGTPPGSLFSIYGANLANNQAQPTPGVTVLPTTLATASVTVNGELAPLTYVDKGQINAQMPQDIAPGVATVVVKVGSTVSNAVAALVPGTAIPGIFIYGSNLAVAQNYPSYTLNSSTAPAPVGSTIIVYLTGGGPVQNAKSLVTGKATPNAAFPVTEAYSATIGGVPATVSFIGLTPGFVGLYQANIVVPTVPKGSNKLIITIGGTASNTTFVSTTN